MKWYKLRIGTSRKNEDAVSSAMYRGGFGGAVIEDHAGLSESEKKRMFVDILPEQQEDDGQAFLDFYAFVTEEGLLDPAATVYDDLAGTSSAVNLDRDRKAVLYTEDELKARVLEIMDSVPGTEGYTLDTEIIEDENWAEAWKENFHSFSVGRVRITPPWERELQANEDRRLNEAAVSEAPSGANGLQANEDPGLIEVVIDPGDAFGTGTHETTMLCLTALQEYLPADPAMDFARSGNDISGFGASAAAQRKPEDLRILDAGTGSGILAITALKLGAAFAAGTDLDPAAIRAARENAELNGIGEDRFCLRKGDLTKDRALVSELLKDRAYDIVTANIIAEIIAPMVPVLSGMLKPGGVLITSGILNEKAEMIVSKCKENGLKPVTVKQMGEWSCVTAIRE
ncbi:MAG: 50S ribosomal protein L11 methyltransferase [Lachnospiraceae bacterium]|nr:50S ribosomal protein L11 methyltransferase [Lachnospiraceae bacterium]